MADLKLPSIREGRTLEEQVKALTDAYIMLKRQLEYFIQVIDSDNIPRLNTNLTQISSARGETKISGPLLLMYDKQEPPALRIEMGYDSRTNKFVFNMYDADGNLTLTLNDLGEAKFQGNIETLKDAKVGNNLYIGTPIAFDNKGVFFYDSHEGVYKNIGMFLSEYDDDAYGLYITNQNDIIEIYSSNRVLIGDEGTGTYLVILPEQGYFTLFSASDSDSQVKHGGDGHLHIEHEGSGNLWIEHTGDGVLKIESQNDMSIRSYLGHIFAQGIWRFDNNPYIGTVNENNKILKKSEIQSLISGASGSFTTADGKIVTVTNGLVTSII